MKRLGTVVAVAAVSAGLAVPVLFAHREKVEQRHFRVVREGVLYRSAQLPTAGVARLARDVGLRTVVSLRYADRVEDQAEEKYCAANNLRFVRIEPLSWEGGQGRAEVDRGLGTFLEVMRDRRNHPVLVHCLRGAHRTGAYVAVYRMECEGWDRDRALREMVLAGYDLLDVHHDLRRYLTNYRPSGLYRLDRLAGAFHSPLWEPQSRE